MGQELETIYRILREDHSFLITGHANPDGDTIGSTVALGYILKQLGKDVILYNESGLPERFEWLISPYPITTELPKTLPQWTFVLDCGAPERVGDKLYDRLDPKATINIDHHIDNPAFGKVNWLDVRQPSVATMIAEIAAELGIPLTGSLAEAVYLGLATDTGFFTYGNTTPESLELVAELFRRGLEPGIINPKIQDVWTAKRMKLWSASFATMKTYFDERMAVIVVTREMMRHTNTSKADCEDFVESVRRLKKVRAAVVLREEDNNLWKFSLRSSGTDSVQAVAVKFGGGGHKNAAGGTIRAELDTALHQLMVAIGRELKLD